jgi:outer membrane protein assembly factor BamD (BamD/ComL family)
VQFAISVTDERWEQAIITGEEIMRDYPNSRMSLEVQQKMPQLRARAAEATNPK